MDAPFHIQSLLRAPTGHKAGLPGVRGPGAPLPSELQAWGREDMTTKNLSEGQRGKEGWATKFIQKDAEGDHGGVEGVGSGASGLRAGLGKAHGQKSRQEQPSEARSQNTEGLMEKRESVGIGEGCARGCWGHKEPQEGGGQGESGHTSLHPTDY